MEILNTGNFNTKLMDNQQKYQHHLYPKLINMNTFLLKKYQLLIKNRFKEESKFSYSPLEKTREKQIKTIKQQGKKQIVAIMSQKDTARLNLSQ